MLPVSPVEIETRFGFDARAEEVPPRASAGIRVESAERRAHRVLEERTKSQDGGDLGPRGDVLLRFERVQSTDAAEGQRAHPDDTRDVRGVVQVVAVHA